jgi:MerR family transcriptional regulator/heat shock protein HspR
MAARINEPVFVISVAARLVEMHPQTLRKYEREGLVAPSRTVTNLRLYSDQDIDRLRQVKHLVEQRGLNLAGVQLALEVSRDLRALRERIERMTEQDVQPESVRELSDSVSKLLNHLGYQGE